MRGTGNTLLKARPLGGTSPSLRALLFCFGLLLGGGAVLGGEATAGPPTTRAPAPPLLPIPWRPVREILGGMVQIPAGSFGRGDDRGEPDERPARRVYLPTYYIDRLELSRGEYARCVRVGGCSPSREYPGPEAEDLPVVGVNWYQAREYCLWAGKRLPTEAEWEKAARGTTRWRYPWGDESDPRRANTRPPPPVVDAGTSWLGELSGVGEYGDGVSPFGVLNLSGNAAEWVLDWYDPGYYDRAPKRDPRGPAHGTRKGVRGGSFHDPWGSAGTGALRTTSRRALDPHTARPFLGFRCAWVPREDLTEVGDSESP